MRRLAIALGICLVGLVGSVEPASAVGVAPGPSYWDLIDKANVDNSVVVAKAGEGRVRVEDTAGVFFDDTAPCVAESPQAAVCEFHSVGLLGASIFDLGGGDDSLTVLSFPFLSLAMGGPGNDVIAAPPPERIPGLPGSPFNDTKLRGGAGNDVLIGGGDEDDMRGGPGDDACTGGAGSDVCGGGAGADSCAMGIGADACYLKDGRDLCVMGAGNDRCNGGKGRDRCVGGPDRDFAGDCELVRGFERR